jgi:hypothetical protein
MSGQVLRIPGGSAYQTSKQSANESGKVVSPTQRPPLSPRNTPGTLLFVHQPTNALCISCLMYKQNKDARYIH